MPTESTAGLTRAGILDRLRMPDPEALFAEADAVRREHCGEAVYVRGIVEFSNHCVRNCLYCGLRRGNARLERYRMDGAAILEAVRGVADQGIRTVVLQSGDDPGCTRDMLSGIVRDIKASWPDMAVTLSVGERSPDDYRAFREAGADRFLLKHETVNALLYAGLHPGQLLEHRLGLLNHLRAVGFQVGCGCIVGLPGQRLRDLADEVLFLARILPDMAGIGPFVPQADTPLRHEQAGSVELTLRMLALVRIATRNTLLPATTALGTLDPQAGYEAGLRAGANVIMVGCTPDPYRRRYRIYDGRIRESLDGVRRVIESAGRTMSLERGDSLKR